MEHKKDNSIMLGFWIYLMTDLLMFAVLFAVYAVLKNSTHGGVTIHEIFNPPFVLTETLLLLTSSFTCGLAMLAAHRNNKKMMVSLLLSTIFFGIAFLFMELSEFSHLISGGNDWTKSAFLSSFFTLTGTHGLHILIGIIWIIMLLVHVKLRGLTPSTLRKITLAGLFWHFLDVVWIFIFTIVYLMGGIL